MYEIPVKVRLMNESPLKVAYGGSTDVNKQDGRPGVARTRESGGGGSRRPQTDFS